MSETILERSPADGRAVALVTGAARRVGRVIAEKLAAAGHPVIVHHNESQAEARAVLDAIRDRGGRAESVRADLSDADACEALIAEAARPFGPLGVLVNCASTFLNDDADAFDADVFDRQIAVNLRAPALLVRGFARALPAAARGNVVNILDCKIADLRPEFFTYSVSKAALAAMTEMQARALAPHIRVNGVAPGLVLPSGKQTAARFAAMHDRNLLARGARPEDVAQGVLTLIEAPAITGQVLFVDGGDRFTGNRYDPEIGGDDAPG